MNIGWSLLSRQDTWDRYKEVELEKSQNLIIAVCELAFSIAIQGCSIEQLTDSSWESLHKSKTTAIVLNFNG